MVASTIMDTKEAGSLGGKARAAKMTKAQRSAAMSRAVKARLAKLSPEERSEIMRKAVNARWAKERAKRGETTGTEPGSVEIRADL